MSEMVKIGGVEVSINAPCEIVTQLKKVRLTVVTGGSVAMTRFDQDEVRFTPASLPRLDAAIADYERQCAALSGKRTRYAARVSWK